MEYTLLIKAVEGLMVPASMASFTMIYKTYNTFKVPKQIKDIPEVPITSLLTSIMRGESYDQRLTTLVLPLVRKHGYIRMWNQGRWEVVVSDLKHATEILENNETFLKVKEKDSLLDEHMSYRLMGHSNLLHTDGEDYNRHSDIIKPAFHKNWNTRLAGESGFEAIEKITGHGNSPYYIHNLLQRVTLDILGKYLMSHNFEAVKKGDGSYYLNLYREVMTASNHPLFDNFPFLEPWASSRTEPQKKCQELRSFLEDFIQRRKVELKNGTDRNDLLTVMIKDSIQEEDAKITEEEAINNMISILVSGNDTTANTLTTALYYLSKHQSCQEKARQEILSLLGDSNQVLTPTDEQLASLPYLGCVLKESMRILPTMHRIHRYVPTSAPLSDGLTIPDDTYVSIHLYALFHNEDIYPYPSEFNPERFTNIDGAQNSTFLAFGAGPRACTGSKFASMIQRTILAMLLQKYTFHLGPRSRYTAEPELPLNGLLYPKNLDIEFVARF